MAGLKWYIDRWKAMDKAERKERLRQQLSTRQYVHTHMALKRAMARIKAASK